MIRRLLVVAGLVGGLVMLLVGPSSAAPGDTVGTANTSADSWYGPSAWAEATGIRVTVDCPGSTGVVDAFPNNVDLAGGGVVNIRLMRVDGDYEVPPVGAAYEPAHFSEAGSGQNLADGSEYEFVAVDWTPGGDVGKAVDLSPYGSLGVTCQTAPDNPPPGPEGLGTGLFVNASGEYALTQDAYVAVGSLLWVTSVALGLATAKLVMP